MDWAKSEVFSPKAGAKINPTCRPPSRLKGNRLRFMRYWAGLIALSLIVVATNASAKGAGTRYDFRIDSSTLGEALGHGHEISHAFTGLEFTEEGFNRSRLGLLGLGQGCLRPEG